jgi:hypothetical protein
MLMIQGAVDSLANAIGTELGSVAAGWLVVGMGMANKWAVTAGLKVLSLTDKLPSWGKAMIAFAFAQVAVLLVQWLPFLTPNLNELPVMMTGGMVWLVSMGWHSVLKVIMPKTASN